MKQERPGNLSGPFLLVLAVGESGSVAQSVGSAGFCAVGQKMRENSPGVALSNSCRGIGGLAFCTVVVYFVSMWPEKDPKNRLDRSGRKLLTVVLLGLALLLPRAAEAFCFEEAGETYGVPPGLLWAIAKVESNFNPAAVCYNRDGSYDYGVMQINSRWAGRLGPRLWNSLNDPCTNVKVGASILADCLGRYGYTWEGIGCYNAVSLDKRAAYARHVITVIEQMREDAASRKN